MKVTLLGAGVPTPTPRRYGSAYLLEVAGRSILIDCGPATTYKLIRAGRAAQDVSTLLFTHHHFDHNADYPCFVLTRWDQDVHQTPLRVFGPPPTVAFTQKLFDAPDGAFFCDWNARVEWWGSQNAFANRGGKEPRTAPKVTATDIDASFSLEEDGFAIRTARAIHVQPCMESVAYRVDSADGASIVFTGDTQPVDSVLELAAGADMMICMCWDRQETMEANGEHRGQTGTTAAGAFAAEAGVGTLVLTHINANLDSIGVREAGIRDVAAAYDGRIIFGEELLTVDVGQPRERTVTGRGG